MDKFQFPERVMAISLTAATAEAGEQLGVALEQLCASDPLLRIAPQVDPLDYTLHGQTEMQFDAAIGTLKSSLEVEFQVGSPRIGYLAMPSRGVEVDYTHKRQIGRKGEFARLLISVSPDLEGLTRMVIKCGDDQLPERFHVAVAAGFESVLQAGQYEACAYVGTRIFVTGAAFHAEDSTPLAFEVAARAALRDAFHGSRCRILEPYMNLEILVPSDYFGSVIGEINNRRGLIIKSSGSGEYLTLSAEVPLAKLFGFLFDLRKITRGLGSSTQVYGYHALRPSHHGTDDEPENFPPAIGMRA